MANYTLDGARIDVGSSGLQDGKLSFKKGSTFYVRTVGLGTYGANDFKVVLQLAEVVRPVSDYYVPESDAKNIKGDRQPNYYTTVHAEHVLADAPMDVNQCRTLCDQVYTVDFLKSAEGIRLVGDMLSGELTPYLSAFQKHVQPQTYMMVAFVKAADGKTVLMLDDKTGKLELPMAVRQDKSETLSIGLDRCFLFSCLSVGDLRLSSLYYGRDVHSDSLGGHFKVAIATSNLPSGQIGYRDSDAVGISVSPDYTVSQQDACRIGEKSLVLLEECGKAQIKDKSRSRVVEYDL